MPKKGAGSQKMIMTRELMNTLEEGCAVCGRRFAMGEPVVRAVGSWGDALKYVHEEEAVFDPERGVFAEKSAV